MLSFAEKLQNSFSKFGQLCIGIDPSAEQLARWDLEVSAESAREFSFAILESASGEVGVIKPQIAFYEQFGSHGFAVLEQVLKRATEAGFTVIADAKRGDIGSTMDGYARAWLSDQAIFQADALTVSPFLGPESLRDCAETAISNLKGLFILAATSNPEAASMQTAQKNTKTLTNQVVDFAKSFSEGALGSVGVVIGATVSLPDFGLTRDAIRGIPVLMPGFGTQGARFDNIRSNFGEHTVNLICTASRSIAGNSKSGLVDRVRSHKESLRLGLGL